MSFLNEQRERGSAIREAVRHGTEVTLRPVLMTVRLQSLVSCRCCFPAASAPTQRPLATVVVGSLFTSTGLTLLILTLIYEWAELRRKAKASRYRLPPRKKERLPESIGER